MGRKIVLTGATGLIGRHIADELLKSDSEISILTTNTENAKRIFPDKQIRLFDFTDLNTPSKIAQIIYGADSIINLAGANVGDKRWTKEYMRIIYDSRVKVTKLLVDAISVCNKKPGSLLNASGVGIYGFRGDEQINENSDLGNDFLAIVCRDWEAEAMRAAEYGVRTAAVRTGIVLSKGGALDKLTLPFRFFAGGYHASGKQWISWIHIKDIVSLYLFIIENETLHGPVNGTSPAAVTNYNFAKTIGEVLHRPSIFKVPEFVLRIAAGKFAENLINGQRVYPVKAIDAGFKFKYTELKSALENLLC